MTTLNDFQEFISENKIEVKNLDKMPEIGLTRVLFEDPWNQENEELYMAPKMKMTIAKDQDGNLHALNKVSDKYHNVQHYEAIQRTVETVLQEFPEYGTPKIDLSFMNNGGRMFAKMSFPQSLQIQEGHVINTMLILGNSCDLSKRFSFIFGAINGACSNGMIMWDQRFGKEHATIINKLHKQGTLDLEDAIQGLKVGFQGFSEKLNLWKGYTEKMISKDEFLNLIGESPLSENQAKEVMGITLRGFDENLETAFSRGSVTLWEGYNAATQFITDNNVNEATAIERGREISRLFDSLLLN